MNVTSRMDARNSGSCAPAPDKDRLATADTVTANEESMKAVTCCSTTPFVSAGGGCKGSGKGSTLTDVERGLAASIAMTVADEVKLADIDINEWAGTYVCTLLSTC